MTEPAPEGFKLAVVTGSAGDPVASLRPGIPLVLGRSSKCDLSLDCEQVSRRHAQLTLENNRVLLEDLGSTSGTKVNGRTVQRKELSPGDEIEIGTVTMRLEGQTSDAGRRGELLELLTDLLADDGAAPEKVLGQMLAGLARVFRADRARLFIPRGEALEETARHDAYDSGLAKQEGISRRLLEQAAAETGPTLLTSDETEELRADLRSIPKILRSVLAAPLPLQPRPGVLYLDSVLERRCFEPGDGPLLLAFARATAVCLERAAENRRARRLGELARRRLDGDRLLGTSPAMAAVREELLQAAPSEVTVLVTGESGTGKELVARALHRESPRREAPFVAVNCAAIPPDLVESELFGHEPGAFTGADRRRLGHFELAEGGTLFLDEVGELPLAVQGKLLRVLEERQVQPLGADRPRPVDFRLVAATNVSLDDAVQAGDFREDLFYRLAVFRLRLPPLRDRGHDSIELAEHFLVRFAHAMKKPVHGFTADARAALAGHLWPGNIRELRNVIEQAVVREQAGELTLAALAPALGPAPEAVLPPSGQSIKASESPSASRSPPSPSGSPPVDPDWLGDFPTTIDAARRRFEVAFLERALREHKANMTATAEAVGMSRRGFYDKCAELGIDYKRFR